MINTRSLTLIFLLLVCTVATAQPRHSITKIVGRNSIGDDDANKIKLYAHGWAEVLLTTDGMKLYEAQRHLIEPLEPDVAMSPYARSLYGKALKEGFKAILDEKNENEMSAVNALQVISLLGTEQGCGLLEYHATILNEKRSALRHWASIGLGKSFKTGVLPDRRISTIANRLADLASREPIWYIISRQFQSLADLQSIPDLDSRQQAELENLSLQLQTRALLELVAVIAENQEADDRVRALPFILSSLRMQLIEPGISKDARTQADLNISPVLIQIAQITLDHAKSANETQGLHAAYGEALQATAFIADRILKTDPPEEPILETWTKEMYPDIQERIVIWKNAQ